MGLTFQWWTFLKDPKCLRKHLFPATHHLSYFSASFAISYKDHDYRSKRRKAHKRKRADGINTFYHPFSWKTYLYIFASFLFLLKISISMSTFERPKYLECVIIKTCQHLVCESSIAENGLVGLLYHVKFTKKNVLIQGDVEVRQKMLKTVLTCTVINISRPF